MARNEHGPQMIFSQPKNAALKRRHFFMTGSSGAFGEGASSGCAAWQPGEDEWHDSRRNKKRPSLLTRAVLISNATGMCLAVSP
jgi:hypothetical protein